MENFVLSLFYCVRISNLSGDFVNKSIEISISTRTNVLDETEGLEKMKLLVPKNRPNNDILMSLNANNQDVSQAMCFENSNDKRSVEKLKNIGTYPKQENVLDRCKGDTNEICLNLVDEHVNRKKNQFSMKFNFFNYFAYSLSSLHSSAIRAQCCSR